MPASSFRPVVFAFALLFLLPWPGRAALLPPAGYTNAFTAQPPAADWATATITGGATDGYDTDTEVNATITASDISAQTTFSGSSAPGAGGTAVWSSPSRFIQTRPTQVRYVPLIGKFVNNTGSNATEVTISYTLTIADGGVTEETGKGTRLYYSVKGQANSWTNIPALNSTASANGTVTMRTNITVGIPHGGSFFLLWVDDNSSSSGTDPANRIDDFSLSVTAGFPTNLSARVDAPTNMAAFLTGNPVEARATVVSGTGPYAVQYFTNSGAGNTVFASAGSSSAAPYNVSLGNLSPGTYNIYAVAVDSGVPPTTTVTITNTFFIADPISFALTAPLHDATLDNALPVIGSVTISGGTPPYSVQYYLDNIPGGPSVTTAPYDHNFGSVFVGDHTVRATVTDAAGWTSNSAIHTIHITGPVGVVLIPTNGATFNFGQSIVLEASPGGGTPPYAVAFFTNDQLVGSVAAAPFATNLGVLPEGTYSAYARASDASDQAFSTTNVFSVIPNPLLITLTNPSNRLAVVAGAGFTFRASVAVGAPIVVTNVQFYYDGNLAGSDTTAPYTGGIANVTPGAHSIYAVATDTMGRKSFSATNQLTGVPSGTPLNDAFTNATIVYGTTVTASGSNVGATKEPGEPNHASSGGGSVWWDWTATASGVAVVDTFGSSYDTLLGVYTGNAVNQLTSLGSNDDFQGVDSRVQFNAIAGTVYHIAVDGFANTRGSYVLHITGPSGISFRSPTNNMLSIVGDPVLLAIDISTNYPGPPISRIDFYSGTNLLGSRSAAPFELTVTNLPLGSHTFSAIAIDNTAQSWQVSPVSILVMNEGLLIQTPGEGTLYLSASFIRVSVATAVHVGSITNVQFFVDGVFFGEDNTAPFFADWSNVVSGAHRFTTIGRSDTGAIFHSPPRNISVAQFLMPYTSVWKYLDDGSNQGTNWITPTYNDSAWASGPAPLGFGDSNGRFPATTNSWGSNPLARHPTTYYRQALVISNVAGFSSFTANIERDDGAILYVNGREVTRWNMPGGTVTYNTYAFNAGDDGGSIFSSSVNSSFLVEGTNIFAVEVHQDSGDSSDLWFQMRLYAFPRIVQNFPPVVALTNPTNNAYFLAPPTLTIEATASDPDGSITNVEFFVDGVKIGQDTTLPYSMVWTNPVMGPHSVFAIATDNQGARQQTVAADIMVYDSTGAPFVAITTPADGAIIEGGTNLFVSAFASAIAGITNVQFFANDAAIGEDATRPYTALWDAPFGTNRILAVAYEATGAGATSAVATITVVPNTIAPTVAVIFPVDDATVTTLSSITVVFSERVKGVSAGDLLVNGVPATSFIFNGSNYLFRFTQPPYGPVDVTFASGHGITDFGFPADLPFDELAPTARWNYVLVDRTPPFIAARSPAIGSTVSGLTQISVTFSETATGVDAADLLVNDVPATAVSGTGSNYTFTVIQPPSGAIIVTWAPNHGITDVGATPPNLFEGSAGDWSFTLDTRTYFVQQNSLWKFIKGRAEASSPASAWRQPDFDDSLWTNSLAPFVYGESGMTNAANPGTDVGDMGDNSYTSIYLRRQFVIQNLNAITNLWLNHRSDDGFIAWINGREAFRYNVPGGELPYNAGATAAASEAGGGVPFILVPLDNALPDLVNGTNTLAVHAFNVISTPPSSDFVFNAQLFTFLADPSAIAPVISQVVPRPGDVLYLTNVTITFSEPVSGVDATDLLINGAPAVAMESNTNTTYTFSFAQPPYGPVFISWTATHGIADFDTPPKPFPHSAPGSTLQYALVNPSAPIIASQVPRARATVTNLTELTVTFSESVSGVDAADLLVNGVAATNVSGSGSTYAFSFAQPAYGTVSVGWTANSGIQDLEAPSNAFDGSRSVNSWSYTLLDQAPPRIASQTPPAGSQVTNLTEVTVTFNEPVSGVNSGDLLINGLPAASVTILSPTAFSFAFPQANATVLNVTWANNHGIHDLAPVPNSFNATGPGATWSYTTPDNLAPIVSSLSPPTGATVRSLTQIIVTFSEPVAGVRNTDLIINSRPAREVSGSGAGPYTFSFFPPSNGVVAVFWDPGHDIRDLANPPNAFGGGIWSYTLDPNASFAGHVLISEIMFNPLSGQIADEWLELHNVTTNLVNLSGWRFSRGLNFIFPKAEIPARGYLVVAADLASFQATYPNVTNVIAADSLESWGRLANNDETIELTTALGEVVNSVHYASEGDWARRESGHGAQPVASIVRNGNTATVTIFGHGFTGNDEVLISGADQPEYNGRFDVNNTSPSTFTIDLAGTPSTPATGNIIARHVVDDFSSGWSWFSAADGFGSSLELINPDMPNALGQNWLPSTNLFGTPGRANSVSRTNVAPFLFDVTHFPPVPRSTDPVAITARVIDESLASIALRYRDHTGSGPVGFSSTNMFDDGAHNDGVAGDGLYGAVLPPFPSGTVIEFFVQAADTAGLIRTWPAPAENLLASSTGPFANALYQVDDEIIGTTMPAIRLVMTGTERSMFPPATRGTDAEMNVTMISADGDGTKIRYLSGVRVRGAGSRSRTPPNNRVNIPNDNRWNGLSAINLNGQFVHAQVIGSAVAQKSVLPASDARVIQYRINGVNPAPITAPVNGTSSGAGYGTFVLVEPVNGDLAADLFPEDGNGNVYRASTGNHNADLSYRGTDPSQYLARGYMKTANQSENDWTDMMNLTFAFSQVPSQSDYIDAISTNVNVLLWMRYFAVGTLVNFGETSLFNGRGDDYALYRGVNDPRFVLLGHDFDTIFGQGDTLNSYATSPNSSIYIMLNPPNTGGNAPNVPLIRRFLTNSAFAPIFFSELKRLTDTVFHPSQLNPLMDQILGDWGTGPTRLTIDAMKNYAANRRANVIAQIPLALTVNRSPSTSSNGFAYTTAPTMSLFGVSHAIDTRKVLVNGLAANWSPWDATWNYTVTLQPGINRVLVQSLNSNDVEFARSTLDVWYDDGSLQDVSGTISGDTVWTAVGGPYNVTADVTVAPGVTLTIQPGTTVYLGSGVDILVASGGRLLAEGTDTARIRFTANPQVLAPQPAWGGIRINGGATSPETRIAYAHFDSNGDTAIHSVDGTVFLDHLTFGNTAEQYVSLDRSSFIVQDCVFPAATATFELVHGTGGIKAGGRGIFQRNFFGKPIGYNDTVDFTGGNRPGPIVQFINNVFVGTDDDILDLDSTDAWIERNIFLHVHRNGSPDSASAVSGGADNADTSQITVVGNLFYDVDHAANAKQGNFYTFINNTIVHQTKTGGVDPEAGVITLADEGTVLGAGFYLEGNIIYDAEQLVRTQGVAIVTFTNNIVYPSLATNNLVYVGNSSVDPLFKHMPEFDETTNFTSWAAAQVMWDWLGLQTGSPAQGTGPNGRDKGGVVPLGISISDPILHSLSPLTYRFDLGINRTGSAIPTNSAGFPDGSGITHYKWRLDGGAWSVETPIENPIMLVGLGSGPHYLEAVGRRDSGFYQDDPAYGSDAVVSRSQTWIVDPTASPLRINEVLASNDGAVEHQGTTPDVIELYNVGDSALNLAGVRLTDDVTEPDKFIFPAGATIPARGYLVVYANEPDGTPGHHLGFGLGENGDVLYLYAAAVNGGALLDSVTFGMQLPNLSIGRLAAHSSLVIGHSSFEDWSLTTPTFGAANRAARVGDPRSLRINEWLVLGVTPFENDFIELHNLDSLPIALGGLFLSDEIIGWPTRHQIAPLTFISAHGYLRFFADSDPQQGPEHLNFSLSADQGAIGLFGYVSPNLSELTTIDCIVYQPQRPNISQGRSPNGGSTIVFFNTPTPGSPNPITIGPDPFGGALVINEVLANNATLTEDGRTPDWVEFYNGSTNNISLAGLSVSDDSLQPRRFVFPAGTQIPSDTYLRLVCDSSQPATTNTAATLNTGFGLKANGGSVYLFDSPARGGSLLNAITYGLQTPDLTIGRVPDGGTNWVLTSPTPNTGNTPITSLGDPANLRVNEWMANPGPGDQDWFEIYNPNNRPVALGGLYLTDDLNDRKQHQIAPLSFLGSGTNAWLRFHADNNTGAGADHVSFALSASSEAVGISGADGTLIDGYDFEGQQSGLSEGRFPDGSTNIVRFPGTESPGESNWRWLTDIVVNEALTHTDDPLEDAIELRNLTSQDINIGGWWLSDDNGTLRKYQIPTPAIVPANSFLVIYENVFTNGELAAIPFALSSGGDEVVLSAAANNQLTGYRTRVSFSAADNGVSFGRYVTSDAREEFVAMTGRTFGFDDPGNIEEFRTGHGATNTYPRIGPVVISEIMYHPPDDGPVDNIADEYIELHNITTTAVPLYDPAHSTNVWRLRDAVDFDFPPGTVISPGAYLLVVSFDPVNNPVALTNFRATYNLPLDIPIVGPYSGRLANSSDDIELKKPGTPATNEIPYIFVDRVRYSDFIPWPMEADGTGLSLSRINDTLFGDDPINWAASTPNPGPQSAPLDFDHDGMPDTWENIYNLDPYNETDARLDLDRDGMTNLREYQAGTDPRSSASVFRLTSITPIFNGNNTALTFLAASNRTYSVLWRESLSAGRWTKLADVPARPTSGIEVVLDPLPPASGRIYDVVTPQQAGDVIPLPAILRSPSHVIADVGNDVTFDVMAIGNEPITYQWLFNASPLGAPNRSTLLLTNVQFSQIGLYSVTVTDASRSDTTTPAFLVVRPMILTQPQHRIAQSGDTVTFTVAAEGVGALGYSWRRNNLYLAGQTNSTLTISNVQPSHAGSYSAIVTHQLPWGRFGVFSSNAVLSVSPP